MKDMLKCKIGVLLIATSRFRNLGIETSEGSYGERKQTEAYDYINSISTFCEVVYPGPVYDRQDLEKAMRAFGAEKVDCVFALFFHGRKILHGFASYATCILYLLYSHADI